MAKKVQKRAKKEQNSAKKVKKRAKKGGMLGKKTKKTSDYLADHRLKRFLKNQPKNPENSKNRPKLAENGIFPPKKVRLVLNPYNALTFSEKN